MALQHDIHSWRAWYADGSRYNSAEHSWESLPEVGCIALLVYRHAVTKGGQRYRMQFLGTDCIGMVPETGFIHEVHLPEWTGSHEPALKAEMLEKFPETSPEHWKLGVGVSDERFLKVRMEVLAAKEAP